MISPLDDHVMGNATHRWKAEKYRVMVVVVAHDEVPENGNYKRRTDEKWTGLRPYCRDEIGRHVILRQEIGNLL